MNAARYDRLIDLLCPDKSGEWHHYKAKVERMKLNDEDTELACSALEKENFVLNSIVREALWDEDTTMLKVLVISFDFLNVYANHDYNQDQYISKAISNTYKSIVRKVSNQTFTDEDIKRITSQFKAEFLTVRLYLATLSDIKTTIDLVEMVKFPLMRNEEIVEKALPVILDVWEMNHERELNFPPNFDDLMNIAGLIAEYPDSRDLIITVTKEHRRFDSEVVREALKSGVTALVTGTL